MHRTIRSALVYKSAGLEVNVSGSGKKNRSTASPICAIPWAESGIVTTSGSGSFNGKCPWTVCWRKPPTRTCDLHPNHCQHMTFSTGSTPSSRPRQREFNVRGGCHAMPKVSLRSNAELQSPAEWAAIDTCSPARVDTDYCAALFDASSLFNIEAEPMPGTPDGDQFGLVVILSVSYKRKPFRWKA